MARRAPGKHYRKGLTLAQLLRMFPDDATAEAWFVKTRWPHGIACPHCGSVKVGEVKNRKPAPYRCRDCRKFFSVKTKTLMHSSNLGLQTWAIAYYLLATGIKGTSSMKLHRDLGITQKSAWFLAHRIRETWNYQQAGYLGPVEVDEAYIGGRESNKHASKRQNAGRGAVGKTAVIGIKDRVTNQIDAQVLSRTDKESLQGAVKARTDAGAVVYTDEHGGYSGLPNRETVKHSVGEYVKGQAHTNGIESFWALLKRGYHGTYHQMSRKHLGRYVTEFAGRHNDRRAGTLAQMAIMVQGSDCKQLRYRDLVG